MRHWRALDGLRAFAVLAVVAYHLDGRVQGGALGVDVFFVISGFLITTLLIREWEARGKVSFGAFYMRRALRLLPAFCAMFIFAWILAVTIAPAGRVHPTLSGLPWVFFYVGNLRASYGHHSLGLFGATWSLAEEEQFYFVWPAVCVLLLMKRQRYERVSLVLGLLALAEMVYRFVLVRNGADVVSRIQFGPDTRSDGLLIGCALAFLMSSDVHARMRGRTSSRRTAAAGSIAGVILAVLLIGAPMNRATGCEYAIPAAVVATAVLLWSLISSPTGPLYAVLQSRPAVWLGRRSYGLYIWHFPIILGIPLTRLTHVERLPIHLGLSLAATVLSYRLIELPFLRLKKRWQTDRVRPAETAPVPTG